MRGVHVGEANTTNPGIYYSGGIYDLATGERGVPTEDIRDEAVTEWKPKDIVVQKCS